MNEEDIRKLIREEIKRIKQEDIPPTTIKSRHIEESVDLTTPTLDTPTLTSPTSTGGTFTTPTLTTPVIGSFTSAQHDHSTAAMGGGIIRVVSVLVFDDGTSVATGDGAGDVFFRVPVELNGWNLVGVAAHVQTAGTTNTTDIQIHNVTQAADMLSTKITIDSTEKDSATAATPAVIDTGNDDVATADEIRFDVDAVSTTAPKGLLVEMRFELP